MFVPNWFWKKWDTERKLDLIIEALALINIKLQTLEKKEKQMADTITDAIKSLQDEVGQVVVAEKAAIDEITKLIADLATANDAGNVTAVTQAIADLKAQTDVLNAALVPVAPPVVTPPVVDTGPTV